LYLLTISEQNRNPPLNSSRRCWWSGTTCHRDRSTRLL